MWKGGNYSKLLDNQSTYKVYSIQKTEKERTINGLGKRITPELLTLRLNTRMPCLLLWFPFFFLFVYFKEVSFFLTGNA